MDPSIISEFFAYIDTDRDGLISVDEILEACKVDINGDGVISQEEKFQCARVWINDIFPLQDMNGDIKISLDELMSFNAS